MLYTIVPAEQVFAREIGEPEAEDDILYGEYEGQQVELAACGGGRYRIKRLISTDAQSYLKPELAPGIELGAEQLRF